MKHGRPRPIQFEPTYCAPVPPVSPVPPVDSFISSLVLSSVPIELFSTASLLMRGFIMKGILHAA
jgi:hypothetical protein